MAADSDRHERLQIMITSDELEALDKWRYDKRMSSRASAVRELLRRGLSADGFYSAPTGVKSQDFGIFKDGQSDTSQDD